MSEFTGLHDKVCIFRCLVFNSHEYSVAYENLHPSTDAYKQVAYKKMSVSISMKFLWFLEFWRPIRPGSIEVIESWALITNIQLNSFFCDMD